MHMKSFGDLLKGGPRKGQLIESWGQVLIYRLESVAKAALKSVPLLANHKYRNDVHDVHGWSFAAFFESIVLGSRD